VEGQETCPLPDDPALAEVAAAMSESGQWGEIIDRHWRWVYITDDLRLSYGGLLELAPFHLGVHYFGPEAVSTRLGWRSGPNTVELNRVMLGNLGPWTLAESPGVDGRRDGAMPSGLRLASEQLAACGDEIDILMVGSREYRSAAASRAR
jgi:hypothetical protein